MFAKVAEVEPKITKCETKFNLIQQLKAAMVSWGSAHNQLSQAWAVGSERDVLQNALDQALVIREAASAEYRKHRENHDC